MITSSMEIIGPEKAAEYLKCNTNNYRTLNRAKALTYAADMKNGKWAVNGESIVFGDDGILKDGQHRLSAIVESGTVQMMLVVRGVDKDINIYDCGAARTGVQIAKANGYLASSDMIGAVRILLCGFRGISPKGIIDSFMQNHYKDVHESRLIARRGTSDAHRLGQKASCCLAVYCFRKNRTCRRRCTN